MQRGELVTKNANVTPKDDEVLKKQAVMLATMDNAENDENMFGPFDSVSALMEALNDHGVTFVTP